MQYPSNRWLVLILHRILSATNSFVHQSIQRWLYLLAILGRQSQRRKPSSGDNSSPSVISRIHHELPGTVCPSMQPRSPSPNVQKIPNNSRISTSPVISRTSVDQPYTYDGHNASQPTQDVTVPPTRYAPDNISISSRQSAISEAPQSITQRARRQGRSSLLRPYSFGGRSASRSSKDLAAASSHNSSLNNFSTSSHHPTPSSRAASPVASSTRSSDAGSYHFSIEPETPLSHNSFASLDDLPNVAIPAGEVALPESGEATIATGRLYQTTPEWILRYERNVQMYGDCYRVNAVR